MIVGDDWKNTKKWNQYEEEFKVLNVNIKYFPRTRGISSSGLRKKMSS